MNPPGTFSAVHRADAAAGPRLPLVLCGASAAALRQLREVHEARRDTTPVLISGEPGLDAIEVARTLHPPSRAPFVVVPCAEGPPAPLSDLLFGVDDARNGRNRHLEIVRRTAALAGAGTIVLADVAELPAGLQRRLARVLRDGEVYVQETRAARDLGVRIIATAGPALEDDVRSGRLRPDLCRRLGVRRISLAPLRERAEDIPEFVRALAERIAAVHQSAPRTYAPAALTALASLPWTGNLDELRELLARLHTIAPGTPARQEDVLRAVGFGPGAPRVARFDKLRDARTRFEREYIGAVLDQHRWRMAQAAATLGIERANLYRKVRQLGLRRPRETSS